MRGDFTRDSFDAAKRFRRVLLQQGRVQLDADFNEQASILLRYGQVLATDLIGRFGGPANLIDADSGRWVENDGFLITPTSDGSDLQIGAGHYYVDGILCENTGRAAQTVRGQADLPFLGNSADPLPSGDFLVYLEVFERPLAAAQDDGIAEPALEGLDTAARSRVVWQVKTLAMGPSTPSAPNSDNPLNEMAWNDWLDILDPRPRGTMRAMTAADASDDGGPCIVPIASAFRGEDNQLYRVEIHRGGAAGTGPGAATFKWSRENGSVIFPIETVVVGADTATVTVATLGRDRRFGLQPGDWVEVTDDDLDLNRLQNPNILPLFQVDSVKPEDRTVTLKLPQGVTIPPSSSKPAKHPLLRRWDGGAEQAVVEPTSSNNDPTMSLENGVEIRFEASATNAPNLYRAGDYWLIPARVTLGDIIWPTKDGQRAALPPTGIDRHFAPLATASKNANGAVNVSPLRRLFSPFGT